jgi:hypothetical protein
MNRIRLQELASLLRTVPGGKFDLTCWRYSPEGITWDDDQILQSDENLKDPECNTAGCAVGWACAHKPFQDEGLVWRGGPTYKGATAWAATRAFFELDSTQAEHLFYISSYAMHKQTPEDVADRIEKFITARPLTKETSDIADSSSKTSVNIYIHIRTLKTRS